jgi:ABC-type nickel/cobalt efflux system permease component RcnA
MTTHHHHQAHETEKHKPSHPQGPRRGLHKDWRTWLVIGLMLAAMGIYVLSLDDAVQPGGAAPGGNPAAGAPANPVK